jgi:hypothetical protein
MRTARMEPLRSRRESGQAAVEAALTMPLMLFVMLGTLQLFMMMHGRILTQLAAFQATRAGSLNHANCGRMVHAAILQVLPAIQPFATPNGTSVARNLADAFGRYAGNRYTGMNVALGGSTRVYDGTIIWIARDITGRSNPRFSGPTGLPHREDDDFDQSFEAQVLETKLIFWFPMRIPFANWVMGKTILAHYDLQAYSNQNPLMVTEKANWDAGTARLDGAIAAELSSRMLNDEYVFPITATYTMRMMTPLKQANYSLPASKNCQPTPQSL